MKDSASIAVLIAIVAVAAGRLYQKYFKKDKIQQGDVNKKTSVFSSSKDDDYEPYSKK
jgi:Tfp pilus assembly major pilin PilA